MGNLGFSRNEAALAMAQQGREEVTGVARTHSTVAAHVCSILDDGMSLEIEVEVPGWTDRTTVACPAVRGAVRGAVEKVLRDLGLPSV